MNGMRKTEMHDVLDLNPRSAQRWAVSAKEPETDDDQGRGLIRGILIGLPLALLLWALIIYALLMALK
jgi:hypothetical protein